MCPISKANWKPPDLSFPSELENIIAFKVVLKQHKYWLKCFWGAELNSDSILSGHTDRVYFLLASVTRKRFAGKQTD